MLKIENATVKCHNQVLFKELNFEIREHEHWAIVGAGGSGKSAFLQTLAGHYVISKGSIARGYYERYKKDHLITDPLFSHSRLVSYVDVRHEFKDRANNSASFYYQQRYNAGYADEAPTVDDFLKSQADNHLSGNYFWSFDRVVDTFHLGPLLEKHLIQLSNGESKRLRIAAALLKNPCLLLLDNPLTGLDVDIRKKFERIFGDIAASGICVVMATNPYEIPDMITHVAILSKNQPLQTVKRDSFAPSCSDTHAAFMLDEEKLKHLTHRKAQRHFNQMVAMKNVRVAYGDMVIFDHIDWEIIPGDRWALSGPNGSGKSTLLALINGDHPQAYANDIILFDQKRGSGETIWDIKKKIGFMSPELFQYFPAHYTGLQVVASGFHDTIGLFACTNPADMEIAADWMTMMGLFKEREIRLAEMSATSQRLCLLARALVKNPYLLLLDEPCQGFDEHQQAKFRNLIDEMARVSDLTMVYVTHHHEILPGCISKTLTLEGK